MSRCEFCGRGWVDVVCGYCGRPSGKTRRECSVEPPPEWPRLSLTDMDRILTTAKERIAFLERSF